MQNLKCLSVGVAVILLNWGIYLIHFPFLDRLIETDSRQEVNEVFEIILLLQQVGFG